MPLSANQAKVGGRNPEELGSGPLLLDFQAGLGFANSVPDSFSESSRAPVSETLEPLLRVVKTVLLANGHFAWVTPAIFVIFVDFQGLRSKILLLWVECNIRIFADFRQNHLFSVGGKITVSQNDSFENPDTTKHNKWHCPAKIICGFSTRGGLLIFAGHPLISAGEYRFRFLYPRSGEKYRRILYRSFHVGFKGSPTVALAWFGPTTIKSESSGRHTEQAQAKFEP